MRLRASHVPRQHVIVLAQIPPKYTINNLWRGAIAWRFAWPPFQLTVHVTADGVRIGILMRLNAQNIRPDWQRFTKIRLGRNGAICQRILAQTYRSGIALSYQDYIRCRIVELAERRSQF